ncbi:hypothetical protein KP509_23G078700 [Ceratopteris richardii]|uniref:Smr domain-containing protein n=1 Tax=Ceratopteris richardii TaxID=49495 RepID=A0A8T2S1D0_CERRI|nr:hypothetical protein KP509_23G078700 [Ceratopteris richardii]
MIIDACGKHGLHEEALLHYGDLCNSGLELNVVSYCSIISAMVNVGKYKKAEHLYRRAQLKGIRTDLHLHLKMIHCYTKCKKTRLGHEIYSLIQKLRMKMTSTAYSTVLALYVEGAWYNHAASTLKHLEIEGISLDRSAHGLLIRAFGSIKDNMAPLIKAVEASQYDVCRLLTSLSLTREEGPKWSPTWIRLVKEYIERIEGDDADSQSILGIYNAFLDCFWQRGLKQAAKILLEEARKDCAVSTCPKIYETELVLDIRGLSVGGSKVAVAEWLNDVRKSTREDFLDGKKMVIITGVGSFPNMFEGELAYSQRKGLKAALLHLFEELDSPFAEAPENPTVVEASTVDVFEWISRVLKRETALVDCF